MAASTLCRCGIGGGGQIARPGLLVGHCQQATDSSRDGVLRQGWYVELPQFLQAGVLVLQTEFSCLEQMLRDVVTQYFQGTTNAQ